MSVFLTVASNEKKRNIIEDFFQKYNHFSPSPVKVKDIYVFGCKPPYAKGCAIDHDERRFIFFNEEKEVSSLVNSRSFYDGFFVSVTEDEGTISVKNDFWGQVPKFYFSENGVSACSDSLYLITELRKHIGFPCVPNEEIVLAKSWIGKSSLVEQIFSEETIVSDVFYCPPGSDIKIDSVMGQPYLSVERKLAASIFLSGCESYQDLIKSSAQKIIDLSATYLAANKADNILWLSGGLDSRLVLASFLNVDPGARSFRVKTNDFNTPDGENVKLLSESYKFPLNKRFPPSHIVSDSHEISNLKLWMLFSAGCYDPLHLSGSTMRGTSIPKPVHFHFTGHGAELFKGNYGFKSLENVILGSETVANKDAGYVFLEKCLTALNGLGFDADTPFGSEWHYLAYRNAIHSGRSITTNLIAPRVLFSKELVSLSRQSKLIEKAGPGFVNIAYDLLIAMSSSMAEFPFAEKYKNISKENVYQRYNFLGIENKIEASPYSIIGKPSDVPSPMSDFADNVASRHYDLEMDAKACKDLAISGYEKLPSWLRRAHEFSLNTTCSEASFVFPRGGISSCSAGRLMSFTLFD